MSNLIILIFASLILGLVYSDLAPGIVQGYNINCPQDFGQTCDVQCPNGNYLLDDKGCPTCACATTCPQIKCRANCGTAGYVIDENGCQTCKCATKQKVQCSKVMCRMFCEHGFKRDENGCEYCACNRSPQECPKLNCGNYCPAGYRKDYSGCQTCECIDEPKQSVPQCTEILCDLNCKNGYQRDEYGCQKCACNQCPQVQCRMFCTYGFRKNLEDGCETCECDWSPIEEKIQCDERIRCTGARVCNLESGFCETVSPDRVNWFLYDFQVENQIFDDEKFIQTFKNGLIHNIATKYGLSTSQITVSSVEEKGLTSFQIMPFFNQNMEVFDKKMDQIDADLNSHEFRDVLPAVADVVEEDNQKSPSKEGVNRWCGRIRRVLRSRPVFFTTMFILALVAMLLFIGYVKKSRGHWQLVARSDSKLPICDGGSYVVAESEDFHDQFANDKRALV